MASSNTDGDYTKKMEKKLEEVQYDTHVIGFYYVTSENEHLKLDAIKLLKLYEDEKAYSVMLCYDKDEAVNGTAKSFKAY